MVDTIIVGSGPAGCVLANRLSEDPTHEVLLLEAGSRDRHPYIHMPAGFAKLTGGSATWGWSTVPQANLGGRRYWFPQGRILGGGSSINAMVYTRGHAADYDAWAREDGCTGWSYQDVLPYFRRAEDNQRFVDEYHSYGGPLGVSAPVNPLPIGDAFVRAAQEAGLPFNHDFNGARQEGCGYYQLTIRNARRSSAVGAYLRPAMAHRNLTVRTGAMVTRIIVERGRAVGVEIADARGRQIIRAERQVLVTSGAIGSPKLLLLSGIGPADELKAQGITPVHDLPGVGKNLQDHLDVYVVCECSGDHTYDRYVRPHRTLWAGLQYLLFKQGPVASNMVEAGGFWWADRAARSPDIQFHLVLGSGLEKGAAKLDNPGIILNSCFLRPRARGTVKLASADPAAHPLIDPNYWGDPYDREISIKGFRLAREIMRQKALSPFIRAERLPGPEAETDAAITQYAIRHAKTDYHPVGTCKMGHGPDAVVDPATLQVHGLEGLLVCDSSIMPQLVSSNTNAPTIMIGERAADIVMGKMVGAGEALARAAE